MIKKMAAVLIPGALIFMNLSPNLALAAGTEPWATYQVDWNSYTTAILAAAEAKRQGDIDTEKAKLSEAQRYFEEAKREETQIQSQRNGLVSRQVELYKNVNTETNKALSESAKYDAIRSQTKTQTEQKQYDSLAWYNPVKWFSSTPKLDEAKTAAQQMAAAKDEADSLRRTADSLQSDVERYNLDVAKKTAAAEAANLGILASRDRLATATSYVVPTEAILANHAQMLFDAQERTGYDAKLLLTDVKQLRLGADHLRNSLGDRLNTTLLGMHINDQIQKLAKNACEIQDKCAAGKASDIPALVSGILGAPTTNKSAQVSGNAEKTDPRPYYGTTEVDRHDRPEYQAEDAKTK